MKQAQKALAAGLLTAATVITITSTSHAQFVETTDAGQTLPTAASTAATPALAGTALTTITGNIGSLTDSSGTDADLYTIQITSPTTFSATTNNTVTSTSGLDTALFLFDSSGHAIATNDDAPGGTTLGSTLPTGNALMASLSPGTYYLGISLSGNEPVNTANQLLFAGYPGGDTTAIRGPASETNPTTENTFNGNGSNTGTTLTAYEIDLTGAATAVNPVPEPSAWASLVAGAAGLVSIFRLRNRRAS